MSDNSAQCEVVWEFGGAPNGVRIESRMVRGGTLRGTANAIRSAGARGLRTLRVY